jgi:3-deoxy-D-manno-octulosonate 8-phosphate phosphatase (KDO 8-P phosphatase)
MELNEKAKNIKLLVIDIDGVLTDGNYQVSDDGKITKSFYTRDFHYIEKILQMGDKPICVLLLTSSWDNCIVQKYIKLPYCDRWNFLLKTNAIDKKKYIEEEIIKVKNESLFSMVSDYWTMKTIEKKHPYLNVFSRITWDNVAYIGDGENDLESMKLAAITGCPQDAEDEIKEESHFVSKCNGGRGAVAEFIKYLISLREENNNV